MAVVLALTHASDSYNLKFDQCPSYGVVVSAIDSIQTEGLRKSTPKYIDCDGDLCTLVESTYPDFLASARDAHGAGNEPLILHLNLFTEEDVCLDAKGRLASDLSKLSEADLSDASWELVDTDGRTSPVHREESYQVQEDDAKNNYLIEGLIVKGDDQDYAAHPLDKTCVDSQVQTEFGNVPMPHGWISVQNTQTPIVIAEDQSVQRTDDDVHESLGYQHSPPCHIDEQMCLPAVRLASPRDGDIHSSCRDEGIQLQDASCLPATTCFSSVDREESVSELAQEPLSIASSCPCARCDKLLQCHLPAPWQNWSCHDCSRPDFVLNDPCWGCPSVTTCKWPLCMDCYLSRVALVRPPQEVEDSDEVHHGIFCDGCKSSPLRGPRFCCTICANYDLCRSCHERRSDLHDITHQFHRKASAAALMQSFRKRSSSTSSTVVSLAGELLRNPLLRMAVPNLTLPFGSQRARS